ncbi:MAG: hypothetical protein R8M11_09770 [Gallionella sp.]
MNNGREQNFWPGFVDALSNLVLTLVFVMVIFVLALFYLSAKVSQTKLEALCPATKAELADTQLELEETKLALQTALSQIGQVKKLEEVKVKKAPSVLLDKITTEASNSGASIVIRFPVGEAELDSAAMQTLDKVVVPLMASGQKIKASYTSTPGPETYSEGKRLAFFRAVAIRNYLIDQGIAKGDIDSKVLTHNQRDPNDPDGRVEIELTRGAP